MPIFKYFFFIGLSLLGVVLGIDALRSSQPSTADQSVVTSSTALDVLKAMAHHGESNRSAIAAAGPLLPFSIPETAAADADRTPVEPAAVSSTAPLPLSTLNAQAHISHGELAKATKPAKKKIASRKPKTRTVYVENTQRSPFDLFGSVQSW